MPLWKGAYATNNRSHTKLVISGGVSPAEEFVADPALPGLFEYTYGAGFSGAKVVLPKGIVVACKPAPVDDFESGNKKTALTIANPGASPALYPIGVIQTNVYKREHDILPGANYQPSVTRGEYIELPYFANDYAASLVKWGAAFNLTGTTLALGDYVVASSDARNLGKVVKFNSASDDWRAIVGQVWGLETNLPPTGWLKWVTPEVITDPSDPRRVYTPQVAPADGSGYAYDSRYKDELKPNTNYWAINQENPAYKLYQGIPGLTDGARMATQYAPHTVTGAEGTAAAATTPAGIDIALPEGPGGKATAVTAVYENGTKLTVTTDYTVTINAGTQKVTIDPDHVVEGRELVVEYLTPQVVGVMPGWDFAGSSGAVRILLKM